MPMERVWGLGRHRRAEAWTWGGGQAASTTVSSGFCRLCQPGGRLITRHVERRLLHRTNLIAHARDERYKIGIPQGRKSDNSVRDQAEPRIRRKRRPATSVGSSRHQRPIPANARVQAHPLPLCCGAQHFAVHMQNRPAVCGAFRLSHQQCPAPRTTIRYQSVQQRRAARHTRCG